MHMPASSQTCWKVPVLLSCATSTGQLLTSALLACRHQATGIIMAVFSLTDKPA